MSLGDHLEELRFRLIRALLAIGIGLTVCLSFGGSILGVIERPYRQVMQARQAEEKKAEEKKAAEQAEVQVAPFQVIGVLGDLSPSDVNRVGTAKSIQYQGMSLPVFTLEEIAKSDLSDPNAALSVAIIQVGNQTFGLLSSLPAAAGGETDVGSNTKIRIPAASARDANPIRQLQTLGPTHGIMSYIKISLLSGLILSSPLVFYQIWMFVAAGLYKNEKKFVYWAAPFSAGLFVLGALFFLLVVAPLTLGFLVSFNDRFLRVESNFTFTDYVSFVTMLTFVFGVAFQTPIAIFFLTSTGLVSVSRLRSSRGYVLLGIVVVAAMATPPDVISQVTLALPLYLLFELGILISHLSQKKAAKAAAERKSQ
ncbi:MAG: twin-arginine translocase subunit TatC [Planctomycetes bacterium]|nr:twin-arginine translocase subunit TatC [Planctomycetota bacterium]